MNLKIPCTSCSDWQPSTMRVWIACFIVLLLMLLLAKVKVDVFRVWPFSLSVACSCCFLHWTWTIAVPSWSLESIQGLLHTSTQLTPTPRLHILTVTQMCTPWRTHTHTRTYIYMHKNMYTLTYANTKLNILIIIARTSLSLFHALLWYFNAR